MLVEACMPKTAAEKNVETSVSEGAELSVVGPQKHAMVHLVGWLVVCLQ